MSNISEIYNHNNYVFDIMNNELLITNSYEKTTYFIYTELFFFSYVTHFYSCISCRVINAKKMK